MKKFCLFSVLLTLALLACLDGVQGQYSMPSSSYMNTPQMAENPSVPTVANPSNMATATAGTPNSEYDYSQYYTMASSPSNVHISIPEAVNITEMSAPTTVYLSNQMQPVNYALYQSSSIGSTSLWIQGKTSWSQYAAVPQGAIVPLLAISPAGGNGYLKFVDADGKSYDYNYYFYPYSHLTFYADLPGRHYISFTTNGKTSNQVIIDVTGTYKPNNYLPPQLRNYSLMGTPGGTEYLVSNPFNSSSELSKFGTKQVLTALPPGTSQTEVAYDISQAEAERFAESN